jgi:membrane protease subunit HflK
MKTITALFSWDNGNGPWGGTPAPKKPAKKSTPATGVQERLRVVSSGPTKTDIQEMMGLLRNGFNRSTGGPGGLEDKAPWVVLALVALWLLSGIYIVAPDQAGVVTRFGAYVRTTNPGLNYHAPWPIEAVIKPQVTRENVVEIGFRSDNGRFSQGGSLDVQEESLMLTGDENILDLDFTVRWKIASPAAYLFNVLNPEATLATSSESVMREVIGRHPIDDALTDNKVEIQQEAKQMLQSVLDNYKLGVLITGVDLQKVNPPADVIDAFRDVQAARADGEKAINEARGYANQIVPLARGQAEQMLAASRAYRAATVAEAEGSAQRFEAQLQAYQTAPDVTRKRMYLEASQDILRDTPKVIVTGRSGAQSILPYLPLDRLTPASVKGGN